MHVHMSVAEGHAVFGVQLNAGAVTCRCFVIGWVCRGIVTLTVATSFNVSSTGSIVGTGTGLAVGVAATNCTNGGSGAGGCHGGFGAAGAASTVLGSGCGSHEWPTLAGPTPLLFSC